MKKNIFIFLGLSFFCNLAIWSNPYFVGNSYLEHYDVFIDKKISFTKDNIIIQILNGETQEKKEEIYPYKIDDSSGITFLLLGEDYSKKWLILGNIQEITIYDSEGDYFFYGIGMIEAEPTIPYYYSDRYEATSELTETINGKTISYPINNLAKLDLPSPWVEGEKDYGIGSEIKIDIQRDSSSRYALLISNGFVSYDHPDLYKKNSRVKVLRVMDRWTKRYNDYFIPDSPDPYRIYVDNLFTTDGIILKIMDVWKGTEYKDTCLNSLGIFIYSKSNLR
ncbi:NADase-type glycan-binding domain-containing protein [Spirochaeta cellobiosiphila]|uniref:NADase-type glycan-binding domain-containing protein n=1 Tax=Spirochaeta cellobiosiphila TaxID=504483 RepID=UPI0004057EB7|nr:hypothetical protein [Spirochaeta cellobiosiphila]